MDSDAVKEICRQGVVERRYRMIIDLTESQCRNLCEFIEINIFEYIRNDTDIDNINWLIDMMETYQKLKGGEQE